jgi:hypothetical protein
VVELIRVIKMAVVIVGEDMVKIVFFQRRSHGMSSRERNSYVGVAVEAVLVG